MAKNNRIVKNLTASYPLTMSQDLYQLITQVTDLYSSKYCVTSKAEVMRRALQIGLIDMIEQAHNEEA
jgi:hypothetical protein